MKQTFSLSRWRDAQFTEFSQADKKADENVCPAVGRKAP